MASDEEELDEEFPRAHQIPANRPLLVLGASGQIGSRLIAAANRAYGPGRVVGTFASHRQKGLKKLDLADTEEVQALIAKVNPYAVILSAAFAWVDGCEEDHERSYRINVHGPLAVAQAARRVKARTVLLSTDYVFDGKNGPYGEEARVNPINEYGRAKLAAEQLVLETSPRSLVVRTNGVYSWDPKGKNFMMQVIETLRRGETLRVPADQHGTPTYAPDLAEGLLELLERRAKGLFHFGGADYMNRKQLAERIAEAFGLDRARIEGVTTQSLEQPARRPLAAGLKSLRFEQTVGRRTLGVAEGVAVAVAEAKAAGLLPT